VALEHSSLLVPPADGESAGFWEGTEACELRIQACTTCGRLRHPPRPMCPWCRSTGRAWRPVSGRGTLWSFVAPHPPLLPGYAELSPYNVAVVAIAEDESIRLLGNLVPSSVVPSTGVAEPGALDGAVNRVDTRTLQIGESVHVAFGARLGPGGRRLVLPYWVLDEPEG
jgi:uncharacterized OB-fold protein